MTPGVVLAATEDSSGFGDVWLSVLILFALLLLTYLGMWRGWRRRSRKHDLAPLVPAAAEPPAGADTAEARYFGTTTGGDWLDRVVARGLGARSSCTLHLSAEGLDVVRPGGSFRIAATALRGARHDQGIAGKVVPPHGLMVVTWQHGDLTLDSGFRLEATSVTEEHNTWIARISTIAKENAA